MADKLALFYVYGDEDDTPYIVRNPPGNFAELLTEWNRLDRESDDNPDADPGFVSEWLRARGVDLVTVLEGPGGDVWLLDDYQPDAAQAEDDDDTADDCPDCDGTGRGGPNTTDGGEHDDCCTCAGEGTI